jgi:hypothetical protein
MSTKLVCGLLGSAAVAFCGAGSASAEVFGGVDFPQGAISFADVVTSYLPGLEGLAPTAPYQDESRALGPPDYAGGDDGYVSLGVGGELILRFTNNVLTGSNNDDDDLWIFEIGPDVEDTTVDVSTDGVTWFSVGLVTGSTRGIDIDAFGFNSTSAFSYVRLTDVANEGATTGATVGADIDAVGAISTRATPGIPEPSTWAMMIAGFGLAGGALRRRQLSVA